MGGARPSGRQVRPWHPNPERARTCRAALARPTFPGALGPGRKSRNHPGHQDPLLRHLGGGTAARHHAASPTRGGSFLPNSPRRAPRKERHFLSARVRWKEGGGGAREMRVGEGDASSLPASRSLGIRGGEPPAEAGPSARYPPPNRPRARKPGLGGFAHRPGSRRARLTLGCSEEPRAQCQQRQKQRLEFPPRSHVCRYSTRARQRWLFSDATGSSEAQQG